MSDQWHSVAGHRIFLLCCHGSLMFGRMLVLLWCWKGLPSGGWWWACWRLGDIPWQCSWCPCEQEIQLHARVNPLFHWRKPCVLPLLLFRQSSSISFHRVQGCSICTCPFRVLVVLVFQVPMAMLSLPRIFDDAPVAHLTPPSWCPAEGAVLVNPSSDRSGMVWLCVVIAWWVLGKVQPGAAHPSPGRTRGRWVRGTLPPIWPLSSYYEDIRPVMPCWDHIYIPNVVYHYYPNPHLLAHMETGDVCCLPAVWTLKAKPLQI